MSRTRGQPSYNMELSVLDKPGKKNLISHFQAVLAYLFQDFLKRTSYFWESGPFGCVYFPTTLQQLTEFGIDVLRNDGPQTLNESIIW